MEAAGLEYSSWVFGQGVVFLYSACFQGMQMRFLDVQGLI